MRGNVIMWNGERGVIAASGRQFDFEIGLWRGSVAPRPDMVVELVLAGDAVTAIQPVAADELAKEKLQQLGSGGGDIARGIVQDVGRQVVIGYAVFAVAALLLSFVSGKGMLAAMSITLPGVLNGLEGVGAGNGGGGLFMVLVALATVAVPFFWKDKQAAWAFCTPLALTLYADYRVYQVYALAAEQLAQTKKMMGSFGADLLSQASSPVGLGLGAYVTLPVAAYLAWCGYQRYLRG